MLLEIRVYESNKLLFSSRFDGQLEIGRQQPGESLPVTMVRNGDVNRLIVAEMNDRSFSRRQALIEQVDGQRIRITNLSRALHFRIDNEISLAPGGTQARMVPMHVEFGALSIRIVSCDAESSGNATYERLAVQTMMPGQSLERAAQSIQLSSLGRGEATSQTILDWIRAVMNVFQSAASSEQFLYEAARGLCEMIQLDYAAVLKLENNDWKVASLYSRMSSAQIAKWVPSQTILNKVRSAKATFRQMPDDLAASLMDVRAIVASPILNRTGEVIGVLYGDRRTLLTTHFAISELEAQFVDLIASGVASGLARVEQEKEAISARVRFEQFFTPELTRQLEHEPDLLQGRDAAVTLLFCDVRKFSFHSERLGPQKTFDWMNDCMSTLSECVIANQGVLVDYIGDELIAMWGAPAECPNQAELACRSAIQAVMALDQLNARWQSTLGGPMDFGIGINSGMARVGNTGSTRKFKYGPLGNTVNLASRVQGTTKQFGVRLLVTGSTVAQLDDSFIVRRLCRVRVVNIHEPVDLYEIAATAEANWVDSAKAYEEALRALENDECHRAVEIAGSLMRDMPSDVPTLSLLSRAVDRLRNPELPFDPIWQLNAK